MVTLHDSLDFAAFYRDAEPWSDRFEGVRSEEVSDSVETGSEPGLREVAVGFSPWPFCAEEVARGACRPGDGEGDEAHQQAELAGVIGQARWFL